MPANDAHSDHDGKLVGRMESTTRDSRDERSASAGPVAAGLMAASLNDPVGIFWQLGQPILPVDPTPIVWEMEWPWARPLPAILQVCDWDIDTLVSSREVATEVRRIWKLWKTSERLKAHEQYGHALAEKIWQRRQGCPIPCPICGASGECACTVNTAQSWRVTSS